MDGFTRNSIYDQRIEPVPSLSMHMVVLPTHNGMKCHITYFLGDYYHSHEFEVPPMVNVIIRNHTHTHNECGSEIVERKSHVCTNIHVMHVHFHSQVRVAARVLVVA